MQLAWRAANSKAADRSGDLRVHVRTSRRYASGSMAWSLASSMGDQREAAESLLCPRRGYQLVPALGRARPLIVRGSAGESGDPSRAEGIVTWLVGQGANAPSSRTPRPQSNMASVVRSKLSISDVVRATPALPCC